MGREAKRTKGHKQQVVRFAVGSAARAESWVWRCWTWRDDVYLGAQNALQAFKVSLHQSRVWRIAFVSELERTDKATDRLILRWKRPGEIVPGLTLSLHILVTSVQPAVPLGPDENDDPRILWCPAVGGERTLFAAYFTAPTISRDRLLKQAPGGSAVVCEFPLPSNETFWIVTYRQPSDDAEIQRVGDVMQKTQIHLKHGPSVNDLRSARILEIVPPDSEFAMTYPTIFDIPLGEEAVRIDGAE